MVSAQQFPQYLMRVCAGHTAAVLSGTARQASTVHRMRRMPSGSPGGPSTNPLAATLSADNRPHVRRSDESTVIRLRCALFASRAAQAAPLRFPQPAPWTPAQECIDASRGSLDRVSLITCDPATAFGPELHPTRIFALTHRLPVPRDLKRRIGGSGGLWISAESCRLITECNGRCERPTPLHPSPQRRAFGARSKVRPG